MRIEPKETTGFFWLPAKPDDHVPGILSVEANGKTKLTLIGHFGDIADAFKEPETDFRILGVQENGRPITLDRSNYLSREVKFGGISKPKLVSYRAYDGADFGPTGEPTFTNVRFSVEGLDEWLGVSGIRVTPDYEQRTCVVDYTHPEKIVIPLPNGSELSIGFDVTFPQGHDTQASLHQKAYVYIRTQSPQPVEEHFSKLIFRLNNFLCFAIGQTVTLDAVEGYVPVEEEVDGKKKTFQRAVRIYYESLPFQDDAPKIARHRMLFAYPSVRDHLPRMLERWLIEYEALEPAFNLYFAAVSKAHRYLEGRFLSLMQSLETLHRRTSTHTYTSPEQYSVLAPYLLTVCPPAHQKWLAGKLQYGNEISLRERLRQLLAPFLRFFQDEKQRKKLVNLLVNSRNYLTHYDESSREGAAHGGELYPLCLKLECLFTFHVLAKLGLTEGEIDAIVAANAQLKHNLAQPLTPLP